MLCLSSFEPYSRWVPLSSDCITGPFKEPVCGEGLSSFDVA